MAYISEIVIYLLIDPGFPRCKKLNYVNIIIKTVSGQIAVGQNARRQLADNLTLTVAVNHILTNRNPHPIRTPHLNRNRNPHPNCNSNLHPSRNPNPHRKCNPHPDRSLFFSVSFFLYTHTLSLS